jgi:2-(1,2-epoxy-1,2-dihydrophenyl)acetyl-CoA isomerase
LAVPAGIHEWEGSAHEFIIVSVSDGVATLRIQRPAVSNAIDITHHPRMHLALDQIQKGDSGARAVVITGSNDVFCSGLDLHSVDLKTQEARQRAHFEMRRFMDPLILRLSGFRFPIVAAVNGAAVGAGMSLALASDIIIAGESAYFLPSFARLGLVPDAGITFHLARRIGGGRSLSSLMLAEKIDAKTALDWGLAYAVVPDAEVVRARRPWRIGSRPGRARCSARSARLHASTFDNSLQEQLRAERSAQEMTLETHDCVEGVRAFFEKREPHFSDRIAGKAQAARGGPHGARMSSGVVRQQPPISRAPASYHPRLLGERLFRQGAPLHRFVSAS